MGIGLDGTTFDLILPCPRQGGFASLSTDEGGWDLGRIGEHLPPLNRTGVVSLYGKDKFGKASGLRFHV